MRKYKVVIFTTVVGIVFLVGWIRFLRTDGDVGALVGKAGIALFGDSLDRRISSFAGWRTTNCGRVPSSGGHRDVTECALAAFAKNQPFQARYDIQGKDSVVSLGFVRTRSGELYLLLMDDESHGTTWAQDVRVQPCPRPLSLKPTQMGRLTCYPESETPYR
jgi:hypothetical protein